MFLINSQKAMVALNGDLTLRPGYLINIQTKVPGAEGAKNDNRKFSGRWLVTTIEHVVQGMSHKMMVGLSRDSTPTDPDTSYKVTWFEKLLGWLFG